MVCAALTIGSRANTILLAGDRTGTPKVGDLGIFMHLLADAMANVVANNRKTVGSPVLYCCRYIRQTVAFHRAILHEGFSGDAEKFSASGKFSRVITARPNIVIDGANIDAEDIAFLQNDIVRRYSVPLVVDR